MIEISAVSYLNALPMVYGLQRGPRASLWSVRLELPAQSALSLRRGEVQIALMPVGALHVLTGAKLVGDYCVGAEGDVYTVCLCAHRGLSELSRIYLDPDSRTSVQLAQVLANHYWKKKLHWAVLRQGKLDEGLAPDEGVVLIGDKVFSHRMRYEVCYDLASEWIAFTGLPFVFAAWVVTSPLPLGVEEALNEDIAWGIAHTVPAVAEREACMGLPCAKPEAEHYLLTNIDYRLSRDKREGLRRFLIMREELSHENTIGARL